MLFFFVEWEDIIDHFAWILKSKATMKAKLETIQHILKELNFL